MTKVRIYDLSKIVGASNKELVDYIKQVKGMPIKSHSSSIDQNTANQIILEFRMMKKTGKTLKELLKKAAEKEKAKAEKAKAEKAAEKKKAEMKKEKDAAMKTEIKDDKKPPIRKDQGQRDKAERRHHKPAVRTSDTVKPDSANVPERSERHREKGRTFGQRKSGDEKAYQKGKPSSKVMDSKTGTDRKTPPEKQATGGPRRDKPFPRRDKTKSASGEQTDKARQRNEVRTSDKPKTDGDQSRSRKRKRKKPQKPGDSPVETKTQKPNEKRPPARAKGTTTVSVKDDKKTRPAKSFSSSRTRSFSYPSRDRRGRRRRESKPPEVTKKESTIQWMKIPDSITVGELCKKLEVPANEIIKRLMNRGIMASINQSLNFDLAASLVKKYGFRVEHEKVEKVEIEEEVEDPKLLSPRPPVVTVLGHVDHGKTSLLDCVRKTDVAGQESGGITQNIGAHTVKVDGRTIVFLDTPGHEAFTEMRARGAMVTDIAVLVVAADDGVMPQTIEAINHAKAAGVPIIVAINKVDKPEANPERVKQQLAEYDLIAEDWGGDIVTVPVSAKTKVGIEDLLEMILLVADVQELKANPKRNAVGTIIESSMNVGLGAVATVVVQNGTLKVGDVVIAGNEWGKIKAMLNDKGRKIKKALPSYPAEIIGLSGVPEAGDHLLVYEDEKDAKTLSEKLKEDVRTKRLESTSRTSLEELFKMMKDGETKTLNIILKADVVGSVEALRHSLQRLSTSEVSINIIHGGVGTISKTDIMLANASNAIIIGFNVRPDTNTKREAEQEGVEIRLYRVIYHVIEDVKLAMVGLLEPEYQEVLMGRATVRATFKISKLGVISGCYVTEGKITRGANARIIRDGVVIYEGKIGSLRRFKDDVKEVEENYECGIGMEKFGGMQPGDIFEAYSLQEVKRELSDSDSGSR